MKIDRPLDSLQNACDGSAAQERRCPLTRVRMGWLVLSMLLLSASWLQAQLSLSIGRGGAPWDAVLDSSAFVQIAPDSIWIWSAKRDQNIAAQSLARGGGAYVAGIRALQTAPGEFTDTFTLINTRVGEKLVDGDQATAFNPNAEGLEREVEVFVDLGGVFGINRVRIFPRLDSEHVDNFPQSFEFALGQRETPLAFSLGILDQDFSNLIRYSRTRPNDRAIIDWPGTRQVTGTRQARYLRFAPLNGLPWEIAEIEVYADGTAPTGEFVSIPLLASSGTPVWGIVRHEGETALEDLPVVLQTRTGPDEEPLHYYVQTGERLRRESRDVWQGIDGIDGILGALEQGPVLPNPEWSSWETVDGNLIRSPSPNRYIQFRVRLLEPGAKLERLVFEYSTRPLADELRAEVSPLTASAGVETPFVLSLQMRRSESGTGTGFRFLSVQTPAQVIAIDSVRVDDANVVFTTDATREGNFDINLWQRVVRDGSFVQIFFRAAIFIDGTRFQVRVLDRRKDAESTEIDTVYQFAREGDVDPLSLGSGLAVRLAEPNAALVGPIKGAQRVLTPNGDGHHDFFRISYDLLKLTRPAPVFFEIFSLDGQKVRRGFSGLDTSGRYARIWDGRDDYGHLVTPGIYLYRVEVDADSGTSARAGTIHVVY